MLPEFLQRVFVLNRASGLGSDRGEDTATVLAMGFDASGEEVGKGCSLGFPHSPGSNEGAFR
jgi:hypothetical protein